MEERIDPVEMNNDPCRSAGSIPRKGRCMKCAKTLSAARAMSSDVITYNKNDGREQERRKKKGCSDKKMEPLATRRGKGGQGEQEKKAKEM